MPAFIEGTWVGYPADSSFKSVITYKLSLRGKYLYAENLLYGRDNQLFRTYEGMYFAEGENLKYHLRGSGAETHVGEAFLSNDTLLHVAKIFPAGSTKSYRSAVVKTGENTFSYYANYSSEETPPNSLEFDNPINYIRQPKR